MKLPLQQLRKTTNSTSQNKSKNEIVSNQRRNITKHSLKKYSNRKQNLKKEREKGAEKQIYKYIMQQEGGDFKVEGRINNAKCYVD